MLLISSNSSCSPSGTGRSHGTEVRKRAETLPACQFSPFRLEMVATAQTNQRPCALASTARAWPRRETREEARCSRAFWSRSRPAQRRRAILRGRHGVTRSTVGKRRGSGQKGLFAAGPRRLCRGIDERPFPRHQLGEKPAACRAEHEAVMLMAEIKPQVRMARHPADDRQHVSPAGTAGSPSSSARSRPHNAYGRRG